MFRNIDQRNNLVLLTSVLLLLFKWKSIRTYLRQWWRKLSLTY